MEIYKNASETIYLRNYVNGVLTDLESTPSLDLELFVGEETEEFLDVTVATGVTGVYSATVSTSVTEEEGLVVASWRDGETPIRSHTYEIVTPYVETYDLINISPDGTEWEDMKYAEKYARNKINQATGQTFGSYLSYVNVPGRGTDVLPVDKRIQSISKMYENTELVIDVEEDLNDFCQEVRVSDTHAAVLVDRDTDIIEYRQTGINLRGSAFPESYQYKIEGRFGYPYVPSEISSCAKELVADYWCNDKKWRDSYISKMKSGDWQVEYHPGVFMSTGNSYVDAILSDYLWHRFMVL